VQPQRPFTTRQRREQAVLAVHTGHGKGKDAGRQGQQGIEW
jgi:ATP:corrinoid adenosyltransferase